MQKIYLLILACIFILMLLLSSCSSYQKPYSNDQSKNDQRNDINNQINNQISNDIKTPISTQPVVISEFSTKIIDKAPARMDNLKLAASMINGRTVNPGETFSFNAVVGEATEARGFKKAITLDRWGRKVLGDGGGICQISSTLFNAAEMAGMSIVEKHSHNKGIGYVKRGRDATIDYGVKDLKFVNTKTYPVQIKMQVEEKVVKATITKSQ